VRFVKCGKPVANHGFSGWMYYHGYDLSTGFVLKPFPPKRSIPYDEGRQAIYWLAKHGYWAAFSHE
jgi:hypothetical protein